MCSLFGLIDFKECLSTHTKNKILNTLARECQVRGTDATGVTYNFNDRLRIYKRPLPARKMKIHIPHGVNVVMGHTHMRHKAMRSLTRIITRSLVTLTATALLSCITACSGMTKTCGWTKTFLRRASNLDKDNSIWFVVGNNPLCVMFYDGFLIYASTQEILCKAIKKLHLKAPTDIPEPKEGEILKIDRNGRITTGTFTPHTTFEHWWRKYPFYRSYYEDTPTGMMTCLAWRRYSA